MNNFCTNCGMILQGKQKCPRCGLPIVDIEKLKEKQIKNSNDVLIKYVHEQEEKRKKFHKSIISFIIVLAIVMFIVVVIKKLIDYSGDQVRVEYIDKFIKQNYGDRKYSIKSDGSGKCIISGDCYFDPVMGCDGGACRPYEYDSSCKSYYYDVTIDDIELDFTVFKKDDIYKVILGNSIEYSANQTEEINKAKKLTKKYFEEEKNIISYNSTYGRPEVHLETNFLENLNLNFLKKLKSITYEITDVTFIFKDGFDMDIYGEQCYINKPNSTTNGFGLHNEHNVNEETLIRFNTFLQRGY